MKLEYKYGQTYFTDLHPGDMIPTWSGDYRIITAEDIDENGCLKTNLTISNKLLGVNMSDKKEILEQVINTLDYCKVNNFTDQATLATLEEWALDKMEKLDAYEKSGLPKYIHWKDVLEMNLDSSTKYIPVKLGSMHCMLIIFDANEVRHADLQYISSRFLRFDSNDFDERLCLFDDLNLETLEDIY